METREGCLTSFHLSSDMTCSKCNKMDEACALHRGSSVGLVA